MNTSSKSNCWHVCDCFSASPSQTAGKDPYAVRHWGQHLAYDKRRPFFRSCAVCWGLCQSISFQGHSWLWARRWTWAEPVRFSLPGIWNVDVTFHRSLDAVVLGSLQLSQGPSEITLQDLVVNSSTIPINSKTQSPPPPFLLYLRNNPLLLSNYKNRNTKLSVYPSSCFFPFPCQPMNLGKAKSPPTSLL